ncbi:MAG: hypothetical protein WB440_04320, partial [Steroidobacteraceae bacterium]
PLPAVVLAEAQFLLDALTPPDAAAPAAAAAKPARLRVRWPRVEDRVIWLIDLFERLERRERSQRAAMNAS